MPDDQAADLRVRHNEAAHRFELTVDGALCRADYRLLGNVMAVYHTEVPPVIQGRGIAAKLVQGAVEHARANGLRIAPYCSYVRSYVRRHPEVHDVLATGPA